jgi:hypothetical protein
MELKDFVKGTISDIALAIKELNDEKSNIGLLVNPNNYDQIKANEFLFIGDGRLVKDVEFNLSISASDTTEAGGSLKINVLKAGISNEANNSTVSTIRFSIPVVFPGCDAPKRDYSGCG